MDSQKYQTNNSMTQSDYFEQEIRLDTQSIQVSQSNFNRNVYHSHEHQLAIEIMCKIIERNYSRYFIKGLTFAFIQSLRKPQKVQYVLVKQTKKQEDINWPFRDLYIKRYKSSEEQELFQFVNLCAEMIQSKFKAYLTRKRHMIAYTKAKRAKDLLQAFVKRWKAFRTYNCQKIMGIRAKVRQIQKQIDIEQQNFSNRDAKKLKGLYKYIQIYTKMFKDTYNLLMQTGMWTLQKNLRQNPMKRVSRTRVNVVNVQDQRPIKNTRGQFRKKDIQAQKIANIQIKKQNVDLNFSNVSNVSNQFMNSYPKQGTKKYEQMEDRPIKAAKKYEQIEDRPIKAAGEYNYNLIQKNQSYEQTEASSKQNNKKIKKQQPELENDPQKEEKLKQRLKKAQQLQKRKKYDPRKAIQEEKKKKKENEQEKKNNQENGKENQTIQTQKVKKIEKQQKSQYLNSQQSEPANIKIIQKNEQSKVKKMDQNKKKQVKNNMKNESNLNEKNLKKDQPSQKQILKKVSSKVDCWTSKKQSQPEWVKQYKSRIIQNRQESEQKNFEYLRKSVDKYKQPFQKNLKIKEEDIRRQRQRQQLIKQMKQREIQYQLERRITKQKEMQVERDEQVQYQRMRVNSESRGDGWHSRQQQIESLKQKQNEFLGNRKNSTHNLHEQVRAMLDKKNNIKKRQVHRTIEQLEQTYSKHYGDRFQNLMPKLSLLTVARNKQREGRVPVLCDYSDEFEEWFQQLYYSTQYWKVATQHEKIFKTFMST